MADWNGIGMRAVNFYFNCFRKTEDYDQALEEFDGEIFEKMEDYGHEVDEGWQFDLQAEAISSILDGVVHQAKENGGNELIGALHTHISDKLFDAQHVHGEEQVSKWNNTLAKILDE